MYNRPVITIDLLEGLNRFCGHLKNCETTKIKLRKYGSLLKLPNCDAKNNNWFTVIKQMSWDMLFPTI